MIRYIGAGCIVEFMQGNRPTIAYVLDEQNGKFRLLSINKREVKIAGARLLPWTGPALAADLSREDIVGALQRHQEQREAFAESVDVDEIWSLAQGEVDKASVEWLADFVFDESDADRLAGLGRALLAQKVHFKYTPPDFEFRTAEQVEKRLEELEAANERERILTAGRAFFQALWKAGPSSDAPPCTLEDDIRDRLETILFTVVGDCASEEDGLLWGELKKGLPDSNHLALMLAQSWGLLKEHHNYLVDQAGYDWGDEWSEKHRDAIKRCKVAANLRSLKPDDDPYIAIDAETTQDIDDAFHIARRDDGGYRLKLAFACPALEFPFDSELDRAVYERATSVYLPEGTSHMLPEELGLDFFSLKADGSKPAMTLEFELSDSAETISMSIDIRRLTIQENATYEAVEARLEAGLDDGALAALEVAEGLRAGRIKSGAVVIERSDPLITLQQSDDNSGVRVNLDEEAPAPKSHLIISEFMILANSAVADFAKANGIALLYRTQEADISPDMCGAWQLPEDAYKAMRLMGCTLLETTAKPHAGLGLQAYAPVSSPLRRYPDLINQGQIVSFLENGKPRLSWDELDALLPAISARMDAIGRIQRYRPRYWKLLYFRQNRERLFEAVVVDVGPPTTVSLPCEQIYLRAPKNKLGDLAVVGQRVLIRLGKVNPLENEIEIEEVLSRRPEDFNLAGEPDVGRS